MDNNSHMDNELLFDTMLSRNQVLKSLYANAGMHSILVFDRDGHVVHMNDTFHSTYGYTLEEVRGMHGRIFFTKEDRDKMLPEREIEKVQELGCARDRNYILHKNGFPLWSDGESVLVTDEAEHVFIFKIIQNLHEQKRLELFLTETHQFNSSIIDSIHDGMLVLSRDGKIMKSNYYFHELFEETTNVEGKYIKELRNGFFSEDRQKELQEMMYSGTLRNFEFEYNAANNEVKNIFVQVSFIHKDHDRTRLLLLFRDVTLQVNAQRKIEAEVALRTSQLNKANQALQVSNAALKRSNANLEQFAYAASHNLKEPVRKIHLFSNQLKDALTGKMEERDRRNFEKLETSARHMSNQINELLSYAEAGIPPEQMEEVDLNKLVEDILQLLAPVIQQKQASITVAPLPTVTGHAQQLKQVFVNLLTNALQFQQQGATPQVAITVGLVPERELPVPVHGNPSTFYHIIQIKDNGIGFDPKYAEEIFKVFYRLHSQHEYEGSGIGLAIVHRIVQNHDGFIIAQAIEGQGAVFQLYLPQ